MTIPDTYVRLAALERVGLLNTELVITLTDEGRARLDPGREGS